jgi:hypothetical protein
MQPPEFAHGNFGDDKPALVRAALRGKTNLYRRASAQGAFFHGNGCGHRRRKK